VRDPDVDAVYIPLPNSLHREWTLRAVAAGKHVLCEKPLGLTAAECREMIGASQRAGVWLMEAFMYRYNRRTQLVREILRSGVLGEIRHVNSTFRFLLANPVSIKLQPALGGGALYDIGCYPVNFIGLVADEMARAAGGGAAADAPLSRPISVSAESVRAGGVDISFSGLLRYESGLIGALHCGLNANRRIFSEITGTKGVLEIPDTFFDNPGVLTLTLGEERSEIPVDASDRYRSEIEDFADAIRDHRPPQFPLTETLRNAEVMDRLFASVDRRTPYP
jgi:D-xylose 1-dehydrogenase (NADP+, D-xylono-1,5-lactone-forming)